MSKELLKQMEMFDEMSTANLSPNQYYLMCCMRDSVSPLKINMHLELRNLKSNGWITQENKLTPQAVSLIDKIEKLFSINKTKTSTKLMSAGYKENIARYRMMFPNKKLASGKPARSSVKNLEKAFRWFFENYDYTWDTVFKATAVYVTEKEDNGDKYMQTAQYFIRKDGTSALADECQIIEDGGYEEDKITHSLKVV